MRKQIVIITLFFIGLVVSTFSANAQRKWTLRECIDYAIENNIEIKQSEIKVKESEISLSSSKSSRLPNLNANVGQSLSFGRSTLGNNLSESVNTGGTNLGISASVPIFDGFKITNEIKTSKLNLQVATHNLETAKENMELRVTSLYLEVLFKKEILEVNREQMALTQKQVDKTKILVDAGKVPVSQAYDIASQLAKDELSLVMVQNDLDLALLNLSQQLNITDDVGFDIVEPSFSDDEIENQKNLTLVSDVYAQAIQTKSVIKAAEYSLASSQQSLKVAQSGYWPSLSLNAGYSTSYTNVFNRTTASFGNQLRDFGRETVGLTLSIPIFNRFQVRNQVRSAKLNISNSDLVLDNVKLSFYKEIQQACQSANAAQSKYASTEKAYKAAGESFRYAEERYAVGKSSVYELSESQTKLLTSRSEQIQAKYDFLFRNKIIDFYRGVRIDIE